MESELLEYKDELHFDLDILSQHEQIFSEEAFFDWSREQLEEAGILDDVNPVFFRDSARGQRLDGYCWNPLENTLCGIVTLLSDDREELSRLTQTEAVALANRARRFFEAASEPAFLNRVDPSQDSHACASFIGENLEQIIKIRIVIASDLLLSDRVKSIKLEPVMGLPTSVEIWDLSRFHGLATSQTQTEPFIVDATLLGEKGLPVIKGADLPSGATAYLGVMPGATLSKIYDEFGQRLLEGNVRTFLDFRSSVNRGLRITLATEPENFFAFNNGITLTADTATVMHDGDLAYIHSLTNLQIVNGGQTTAALYFAPKEAGGIQTSNGLLPYRKIDLEKVAVQMKLTVFEETEQDRIDEYRANISRYANSQNSIQGSDLVSNHPIHLNIERLSRKITMPASETGLASKWFYERTRGQYSTKLRALGGSAASKFKLEYPKTQLFTKTDMAKYVNTWRMRPHLVKRGAQANLKSLGPELIKEYEADNSQFEAGFYRDLIAQAILFKSTDKAVLQSAWYKMESGLKAEAVTYGIALLRHSLQAKNLDINLDRIFAQQQLSESMTRTLVAVTRIVREALTDSTFREGNSNPSQFCKSENAWKKVQTLEIDTTSLQREDTLNLQQKADSVEESRKVNQVSKSISDFEGIFGKGAGYWEALADFNLKTFGVSDYQVAIPRRCAGMITGKAKPLSEKQMKIAVELATKAEDEGFAFINS